jgi:hypothetical protein
MAQTPPEFGARRDRRRAARRTQPAAHARRAVGIDPALRDFYARDPRRAGSRELGLDEPAAYEWLRPRARAPK